MNKVWPYFFQKAIMKNIIFPSYIGSDMLQFYYIQKDLSWLPAILPNRKKTKKKKKKNTQMTKKKPKNKKQKNLTLNIISIIT